MDWIIRFLVISGLVIIALLLFQCIPVEDSWSLQLGTICAQCMPFSVSFYVSASRNILTDTFLIAFATPGVRKYIDSSFWLLEPQTYWSIHHYHSSFEYASESRKIALLGVVSMDILIIIADIVRTISVIELPFDDPLCESIISTRPECFRRAINWPIIQRSRPMPAAIIWTHEYQDRETGIWRIWKHSDFRLQIRVQRKMGRRSRIHRNIAPSSRTSNIERVPWARKTALA